MRFRFCGGLDAPDWLLTEIAIVAKLSTKQITFFAEQVIKQLLGKDLAYDKLDKLAQVVKFTRSDVKAALAAGLRTVVVPNPLVKSLDFSGAFAKYEALDDLAPEQLLDLIFDAE